MEKPQQSRLKNRILKIIPKAAAAVTVTFQNPPFSPGRDHKLRSENGATRFKPQGFHGPMIPHEARRKPKDGGIETQEPTSPKISCMGQIKHKKKKQAQVQAQAQAQAQVQTVASSSPSPAQSKTEEKKKRASKFQRMFLHTTKPKTVGARKSNASATDGGAAAPPLGEMRRFASGRETFSNFDWRAQIAAEEERDCFSEDDRAESDGEDDIIIPFSAPLTGGVGSGIIPNVQPRKEINLWKRRTMAPPRPLQLKPVLTA